MRPTIRSIPVDSHDRIWIFETRIPPNRLVGFNPRTEAFFASASVPSGGGSVRNMVYDERRIALWFATDANTLGQAVLPEF